MQVAWFINSHATGGNYSKDASVHVLTPIDLIREDSDIETSALIALHRFEREVERVNELMIDHSDRSDRTLVLFDGSLAVSYAAGQRPELRDRYRAAAVRMLRTSEESRVPLVAYIDRSRARDFVRMICKTLHRQIPTGLALVSDAVLLDDNEQSEWQSWRSPSFICQRHDIVEDGNYTDKYTGKSYSKEICFTYLKVSSGPPARLEFPNWLLRENKLDQVIDWLRAEAIVGGGYPYAIQAADAAAVVDFMDRQRYQRALEEFGQQHDIRTMQSSAKQASKERRRA